MGQRITILIALILLYSPLHRPAWAEPARPQTSDEDVTNLQKVGGSILGLSLGFGTGQLITGRFWQTGWKFALGETAALTAIAVGFDELLSNAHDDMLPQSKIAEPLLYAGLISFVALRLWQSIDAATVPRRKSTDMYGIYLAPTSDKGSVLGLNLRF